MFRTLEPVLTASTISAIVSAVLAAMVAFNVPITEDQRTALLGLVTAVGAIFFAGSAVARSQVTPVAKVVDNIVPLVPPYNRAAAVASLNTGDPPVIH